MAYTTKFLTFGYQHHKQRVILCARMIDHLTNLVNPVGFRISYQRQRGGMTSCTHDFERFSHENIGAVEMVTPNVAIIIAGAIILIFALALPMLDSIKRFSDTISTRWSIVVIFLALGVGCVIDFKEFSDQNRHLVLLGCLLMSVLYVVFISLEKWLSKGWIGRAGITLKKGESVIHMGLGDSPADLKQGKDKGKDKRDHNKPSPLDAILSQQEQAPSEPSQEDVEDIHCDVDGMKNECVVESEDSDKEHTDE